MSKRKYVETRIVIVRIDESGAAPLVHGADDQEVFNALQRYVWRRNFEIQKYIKKNGRRRMTLEESADFYDHVWRVVK